MKKRDLFKQGNSAFWGTLIITIVINYFGSLLVYNRVEMNLVVDILISMIMATASCFGVVWKRIEDLERRIKALEYQQSKRR